MSRKEFVIGRNSGRKLVLEGSLVIGAVSAYTDFIIDEPTVESRCAGTTEDFGPQRWNAQGDKLSQTDDDTCWVDDNGNQYYTEIGSYPNEIILDEVRGSCDATIDSPKARTLLNSDEQAWMDANEHLLEKLSEDDDTWACNEYNDEQVDSHTSLANARHSTNATEQNKEGYKIFGTNKGHDSAIWVAVRYSKQATINMVKRVKEHLSTDELDYLRYIILDDNISLPSCIRTVLPQHNAYKSLTCWLKTITTGTHYTATGRKVGFTPYPAMFVKARKEMELLAPKRVLHIDYYQPTKSCPEGFANIWTTKGDVLTGTHQICFFTTTSYQSQIDSIIRRAKAAGYNIVSKNDMYNNCIASTGKTPKYTTVRTLWNNPISYIEASVKVLVS
jgi:hypothetical protein